MEKKKILVFIDWYLPGFRAGGPIRSCANLISHLSDEFDFNIVTTDTDYMTSTPYPSVNKDVWNKQQDGSKVYYISKQNLNSQTIKKIIEEVEYDYYYVNGVFSYFFTMVPLKLIADKMKVIVAARGMLAPSALSIKSFKKKVYLDYVKITGLFSGVIFQATSKDESSHIQKIFSKNKIVIAPNLPRRVDMTNVAKKVKKSGVLKLLNIARIAPEKNLYYALEILKNIKSNVEFDFYGSVYDETYAEQCFKTITSLPENIKANHKGERNPDELFELMKDYHFLFLPSAGENFGHVILESMLAGVPVIISDNTPWKELEKGKAGWDVSLSEPKRFIEIIEKCIAMGQEEYDIYSKGALMLASRFCNDGDVLQANKKLFS